MKTTTNPRKTSETNHKAKMFSTRNDIPEKVRSQVIAELNKTLADTLDLKSQVKQAHWNVKGMHFYQLHLLFDVIAGEVDEFGDTVAERITSLGGVALGTVRVAAEESALDEYPLHISAGEDHVKALSDRLASYGEKVRKNIDKMNELEDADTADLYTEISRDIDMRLWFLEAHLH